MSQVVPLCLACTNIPECDKSFTRSDALAKHMRTVHEIETGRPQEPPSKAHNVPDKAKRRRSPSFTDHGEREEDMDHKSDGDDPRLALYSTADRYRYLKRRLRWATDRNAALKTNLQESEAHRWQSWAQKEILLDRVFAKEKINLGHNNAE
jgi:Zinc finger, C2H2 type